jgi:ribosomal protein S18 acetylase RimI-like enzyme
MSNVRDATPDDAEAISRLAGRTFALACPGHTPAASITQHIRTELTAAKFRDYLNSAQFLVVDGGDGVVGYVMLTTDPPPIDTTWVSPMEIRRIYVDESEHGTGVAAALMRAGLDRAVCGGHDWVWLGTNRENARAIRFYRKYGFAVVGHRTFRVADSVESDYVMARPA